MQQKPIVRRILYPASIRFVPTNRHEASKEYPSGSIGIGPFERLNNCLIRPFDCSEWTPRNISDNLHPKKIRTNPPKYGYFVFSKPYAPFRRHFREEEPRITPNKKPFMKVQIESRYCISEPFVCGAVPFGTFHLKETLPHDDRRWIKRSGSDHLHRAGRHPDVAMQHGNNMFQP